MSYEINDLLHLVVDEGAADLHLHVGMAPCLRLSGNMTPVEGPKLTPEDTEQLMMSITPESKQAKLKSEGSADFAIAFFDKARFRVNVFRAKGHYSLVLRQIPSKIFGMRELGLPDEIKDLLLRPRGLILVTGPTGSGKTTTLAAMINWLNENEQGHILTVEDPIEYFHEHKRSLVNQRQLGEDVPEFIQEGNNYISGWTLALKAALREDPDVILVGELRDLDTIRAAVSAAETGHLVFGTLHTTGAARTVDRIVDAFPAAEKDQIRTQLAASIVAVISQCLCRKIGGGRIAGYEIMVNTDSIAALIRDNKTFRITSEIQTGGRLGMITLDAHLMSLSNQGKITPQEALGHSQGPEEMKKKFRELGVNFS